MSPEKRLRAGLLGLVVITVAGTTGYVVIEGATPFDALFMVMITISTVGFGEQFPLSRNGEVFTIAIMLAGVGLGLYTATAIIEQAFVYGAVRRNTRLMKRIGEMNDHVILCGFGRVGRGTWEALRRREVDVVVVEANPTRADRARAVGARVVEGDATDNQTLRLAGIERASALIACVTDDADNLVVVLSAKSLVSTLHVVSRASEVSWESKLRLAGADRVVAPQVVGSERLAAMATEQTISDMFDVVVGGRAIEFTVEEVVVGEKSDVVGRTIRESGIREVSGALVLAMEDTSRSTLTAPSPDELLNAGTALIIVGTSQQVDKAIDLLDPSSD